MRRTVMALGIAVSLLLGCCLAGANAAISKEVVFSQDFQGKDGKKIEDLGWTRNGTDEQSTWEIKDGVLEITCFNKPYKGGYIRMKVPFVTRGEFSFDVNINSKGSSGYQHLSLRVGLYNLKTAFNGYMKNKWMRIFDGAAGKDGDWAYMSKDVPVGKTIKCKILFDASKETIEYYCEDMENPCYVEQGVKLSPAADGSGSILIGNYGVASDTIINQISNIKLVSFDGKPKASAAIEQPRAGQTTVYRGMAFERYRLEEMLSALHVNNARVYTTLVGLGLRPVNSFRLDRQPSLLSSVRDSLIIMADVPLGPGGAVQEALQRRLKEDISSGAHLVILGGLFTLDRGQFEGSPLEEVLPVKLDGIRGLAKAPKPLPIEDGSGASEKVASIFYYHDLTPVSNACVLASADGHPLIVSRPFGKGLVTVFTGMPCGMTSGRSQAFWEWSGWPKYMAQMICKAEGSYIN
ncbi:MAG: hypothetical protein WCT06_06105 [Armatimonadota bacterium]